ncbi:Serine/threonine-protein kinase PrkC [Pirellulimonas nuda]|uniref:non-specific serine/threonine protein kinase n=1 Tax=Pirellulimonas nuda TaxID=2528009 RepID=A0A518D8C8_9BACT|nr:serine/threonine-protein kinase [Pirellulimonas nuda]QDU87742.1 Serine/threonine-protein kinase PrkC [Pirellulimonas nuda]
MATVYQVGDRVGPYRLTGVLGEGGAGQVFRAQWAPTDQQRADGPADHPPEAAVKLLLPSHADSEELFRRFVREIGLAQQIDHPNLMRHLDSGIADGTLYYAMEVVPHGTMRQVLRQRGVLSWRDAVEGAMHVADALSALHQAGVVHRDLKPENIFLSESGLLKLGDFGLAFTDQGSQITLGGQTVGSVRYMAPEQVRGQRDLDGRCDLYALGCVLFEMLTGRPPFVSTEPMRAFMQHVEEAPPRVRTLAPGAPRSLDALVDCLLSKDKHDRPPSAEALGRALAALLDSEAGEVPSLDAYLSGATPAIEPLPVGDAEEEDSLYGSSTPASGLLAADEAAELAPEEPADAPRPTDLAHRLSVGPPAAAPASNGKLLALLAAVAVVAIGITIASQGIGGPDDPPAPPAAGAVAP